MPENSCLFEFDVRRENTTYETVSLRKHSFSLTPSDPMYIPIYIHDERDS